MKTLIAAALTTCLVSTAFANGNADPKLPKEIQPLYCLVGEWKSKDAYGIIAGKKHKVEFTVSCAPTADGMGLVCNDKFDIEGMGHVDETDLFGYDAGQNRYHWFALTGRGETHDHVALPPGPNDKGVVFSYSGYEGGKPMQEVVTMTFLDENKIDFKNVGTIGGESAWKLGATMIKK